MISKFSIIIPTMWKSDFLSDSISNYITSDLIDEIIIIDNDPTKKINLPKNDKIKYLTKGHNIFVNPSWNWGVKYSKNENLLIINDDLHIKDITSILKKLSECQFDFVGLDYKNLNAGNGIVIKQKKDDMTNGFGCFLFIKKSKYIIIPEDIKIWFGDRILFNSSTILSPDIILMRSLFLSIASNDLASITKSNCVEKRMARIIRNGSSE